MKILVIEDNPGIRATLRDILELNGHAVLEAENGEQGLKLAAEKPEFIFCDVDMPLLDGHGVLAALRQMPEVGDTPFVFLTANASRDDQRAGMMLGADDYITKPFTEADIIGAIKARTGRHKNLREKIEVLGERHRREVTAHWSHELLTPLNAVIGSLELLETAGESMTPAELKEMLGLIRAGAERQERLAKKLIRYFGLEQMSMASVADRGVCSADRAVAEGAMQAARESGSPERLKLAVAPGRIAIAHERLRDAVYEVVGNAFTFSRPDDAVTVAAAVSGGRYRIEVIDHGPGMTPEQRSLVGAFVQFERHRREQQGLGLGLAIARATSRLAGGDLELSDGPGDAGLRVVFSLPEGPKPAAN